MRFLRDSFLLTYRHARRAVVLLVGASVLLFGFALLVLPGPAFVVIPAGLGILAIEFQWASPVVEPNSHDSGSSCSQDSRSLLTR